MKRYEIYFSPTGGTKKALHILGEAFEDEAEVIDLSNADTDYGKYSFQEEDVCLIAVPSFGGRVPEAALNRLQRMHAKGTRAVLICTYGNRAYDDTLLELQEVMSRQGFLCIAAAAAVTEHSIMHQFGTGRPDSQDKKELSAFAQEIKKKLAGGGDTVPKLPGKKPYRLYGGLPLKPKAGNQCTQCGICAAKCPVKAIDPANPVVTDKTKCITCMQCVAVCPVKARSLNRFMLFVASAKMKKACSARKENELFV